MRETASILVLFLLCVGCGETPQQRQAVRNAQNAAVAADLKAMGEAMHNDPNNIVSDSADDQIETDTAADDSDAPEDLEIDSADSPE